MCDTGFLPKDCSHQKKHLPSLRIGYCDNGPRDRKLHRTYTNSMCCPCLELNEPLTTSLVKASLYDGIKHETIWNILVAGFRNPVNTTHQIVNSSFQIVFDVILLLIPLPVIRSLKIRSSAKGMSSSYYCLKALSKIKIPVIRN